MNPEVKFTKPATHVWWFVCTNEYFWRTLLQNVPVPQISYFTFYHIFVAGLVAFPLCYTVRAVRYRVFLCNSNTTGPLIALINEHFLKISCYYLSFLFNTDSVLTWGPYLYSTVSKNHHNNYSIRCQPNVFLKSKFKWPYTLPKTSIYAWVIVDILRFSVRKQLFRFFFYWNEHL